MSSVQLVYLEKNLQISNRLLVIASASGPLIFKKQIQPEPAFRAPRGLVALTQSVPCSADIKNQKYWNSTPTPMLRHVSQLRPGQCPRLPARRFVLLLSS